MNFISARLCTVPRCGMGKYAKGLCQSHYSKQRYAALKGKEVTHCPTCTCATPTGP